MESYRTMNRTWIAFLILVIATIVGVIGYEFYISISGGNVSFDKTVNQLPASLGAEKIDAFSPLVENMPVKDATLNNK